MAIDLFTQKMTNKEKILCFIRDQRKVRSSEIQKFGSDNFINEPNRYARTLAQEGKIKRMSKSDIAFYLGKTKESAWEFING